MGRDTDSERTPIRHPTTSGRLDSWKEIAAYLGRGVRTVQRWEREENLPVRRLGHVKRGTVYADPVELNAWWESRRLAPRASPASAAGDVPATQPVRITNTSGVMGYLSLSSDARLIAFVSDSGQEGGAPQIWIQQIGGGAMRLTTGLRECSDPSFSSDDTRVLFSARGDTSQNIYEVPALGGQPRLLKRAAKGARISPDGRWLAYLALDAASGCRVAALDGTREQVIAPDLIDVGTVTWSPDSRHLLVYGHPDPESEPDYWVAPIDGGPLVNTGLTRKLRPRGFGAFLAQPAAWCRDGFVFSAVTRDGVNVWRHQIAPGTFALEGEPERLTPGTEMAWFPAAAAGRVVFVSAHFDMNLWSVGLDTSSGTTFGPLRRMTRGPGVLGHLSVTANGRTLAYFSARTGSGRVFLRDLEDGSETVVASDPASFECGFPAISPGGTQLAFATRSTGPRAMRPIFVVDLSDGRSRQVCDDCGGRPRQWLDERRLLIETFGSRLNRVALIDTVTGARREVLASGGQSIANPRVSPDGAWIAFDAAHPGGSPTVFVAPLDAAGPIPESSWVVVERPASHACWSRDGDVLYYLSTTPNMDLRGLVRARRLDPATKRPDGDPFVVIAVHDRFVPTFISGTAPLVAPDQILFVLGDVRGDIWMRDL